MIQSTANPVVVAEKTGEQGRMALLFFYGLPISMVLDVLLTDV